MANNPYVNKVQLADGTSLIDISDTTATADKILSGYTAYGADGSKLTGTATGGIDGDNLEYGLSLVGSAIVGSSVIS